MRLYHSLFLIFAAINVLCCACSKNRISPAATRQITNAATYDINGILFTDSLHGYMIGGDKYTAAEMQYTSDGGNTWSLYKPAGQWALYGITSMANKVYTVGYGGFQYATDAGGNQWQELKHTGYWIFLRQITFASANSGFIIAGESYHSGRLMRIDSLGIVGSCDTFEWELDDIVFPEANTGYMCGYGALQKTTDGGKTWQLQDIADDYFKSIACIGTENVWIVGYNGGIVHTSDGGTTWERQRDGNNPLKKKYRLRCVRFRDEWTGYACGDNGLLLKTTNGGKNWIEFEKFTDADLKCLTLVPDGAIWVAGTNAAAFRITE
ncbi:MAG: YCF48-related protein [Edaphocola sp.]